MIPGDHKRPTHRWRIAWLLVSVIACAVIYPVSIQLVIHPSTEEEITRDSYLTKKLCEPAAKKGDVAPEDDWSLMQSHYLATSCPDCWKQDCVSTNGIPSDTKELICYGNYFDGFDYYFVCFRAQKKVDKLVAVAAVMVILASLGLLSNLVFYVLYHMYRQKASNSLLESSRMDGAHTSWQTSYLPEPNLNETGTDLSLSTSPTDQPTGSSPVAAQFARFLCGFVNLIALVLLAITWVVMDANASSWSRSQV